MIYYLRHPTPLGTLILAASEQGICGIYFEQAHKHFQGIADWQYSEDHALLTRAAHQLDDYFAQQRRVFDLPLDFSGTSFQRQVWDALRQIPFGATRTYAQHAEHIGKPTALRAIGAAIGRNPISIIVPCHRVIGASRSLTGYAGGLPRKHALLALEGIELDA